MRRILSIDGGGIRGVFPAAFLANLEGDLEHPIGRYFDLIAGTSTGGIIAIGLALGMRATEILEFYETKGPAIFGQTQSGVRGWFENHLRCGRWFFKGPKYDSAPLQEALGEAFGDKCLRDSHTRLIIPAWHTQDQSAYLFKTAHNERFQTDYKDSAVDVAMATASAPTYFAEHMTANDVGLMDGGLWAQNPTGVAVVEAIGVLGWPAEVIKVLSVGCLEDTIRTSNSYGTLEISSKLSGFFTKGQSEGSLGMARILTGTPHERQAIYRISPSVPENLYSLDNTRRIPSLKSLAFTEARNQKPILQPQFFGEAAEEFQPIYR